MNHLLPDGFVLLLLGQAMVLAFIACIILTIKVCAFVIGRIERWLGVEPPAPAPAAAPQTDGEDEAVAAAIAAALHDKRRRG